MQPTKKTKAEARLDTDLIDEEAVEGEEASEGKGSEYTDLLFFYFECTQESGDHVPNLCVVHNESGDEKVFRGPNTRDYFCEWLLISKNKTLVVL